ncbi:MAG: hypothetical protein Q9227_000797 [Pyrenula ochraceoflavens]
MGIFTDGMSTHSGYSGSHSYSHNHHSSTPKGYYVRRPSSPHGSTHSKGYFVRESSHHRPSSSSRGFFSSFSGSYPYSSYSSSSSRARPRSGYISRLLHKLRRFIRDLYYYARRHPVKVFMVVILPLLTGGALHRLLAQFGIRLPPGLLRAFGGAPRGMEGFGMQGRGRGEGRYGEYERYSVGGGGSEGGMFGLGGGGLQSLVGVAKMFM